MKTSNRSIHQPTASGLEAQRLAEFKAMKIAKREADRDKLAREFPLLFGKDAAQKSTIGKYSLKPASKTPSKRKFVDEDVPDENIGVNKLNQTLPSRPTPGKNKAFKPSLSSTLKPKTSTNTTKFSKTTPGGFFGFGAKKASTHPHVEEIANEVEMTNEHILHKVESVEHERVIDNKPAVFVEQVQDVLDYLLENNEVDEKTYRRLSSVNFDAQAIQRFSHIPSESFDDTQAKENNHQIAIVPEEIENSNEQMPVEEMVINDLDIVHALRNYITTMEVLPVPMTTPQPSEYVSLEEEIRNSESQSNEEIPNEEDATNNSFHHRASTMPIFPRRDEVDIYGKEELLSPNSKANNKVIIYPRAVLLEKAMKEGRLSVKVTDYLCRDHHVKYMINAEIIPAANDAQNETQNDAQVPEVYPNIRMMLLKRYSEFKEFRQELSSVLNDDAEPIAPLPSRQVLSLSCDRNGNTNENDYLQARQDYLANWMKTIMIRQQQETSAFRLKIQEFLSN